MSTKLHQRPRTLRRPVVHDRSEPEAPPAAGRTTHRPQRQRRQTDLRAGLIGLGVLAALLLAFTAMVVLTALAGGDTFLG
ncbi:hypothetical protein DQ244_03740 [Blastococcus sp. TBT05-19]|uniref:hypothetical protein n=1 Tax=Blastococcus sp. TBT05-19 TaxID=2250581 RepID=UPI000DE82224|nr:hypothetical protein [Blastococcus sp. TBT05-19]RBY94437.1 hypothetical protein DQ244_03740 [Blastococcus sp. TBT05-19]